jgi:hypothetical protein
MVAVDAVIIEVLSCNNALTRYRTPARCGSRDVVVVVCGHKAEGGPRRGSGAPPPIH